MYKKQMTVQKVICLLSIIASVLVFVYALGLMTDLHDTVLKAGTIETMGQKKVYPDINPRKGGEYPPSGFNIYKDMQPFNTQLLLVSIGLILLSVLLFVTNTASRRRYYIGNFIAVGLNFVANVAAAAWASLQIHAFKAQYLQVDFDVLKWCMDKLKIPFELEGYHTFWFDAHYFVFALTVLTAVLLVLNVTWKLNLMKQEKQLIEAGKAVSA